MKNERKLLWLIDHWFLFEYLFSTITHSHKYLNNSFSEFIFDCIALHYERMCGDVRSRLTSIRFSQCKSLVNIPFIEYSLFILIDYIRINKIRKAGDKLKLSKNEWIRSANALPRRKLKTCSLDFERNRQLKRVIKCWKTFF